MADEIEDLYGSIMTGDQLDFGDEDETPVIPSSKPPADKPRPTQIDSSTTTTSSTTDNNCLYINGLPWWITEDDLRDSLDGKIIPLRVVFLEHKPNGKSRGIAIVEFRDKETCQSALDMLSLKEFGESKPTISFAKSSAIPIEETSLFVPQKANTMTSSLAPIPTKTPTANGRDRSESRAGDHRREKDDRGRRDGEREKERDRERERERDKERERERGREREKEKERQREKERERERELLREKERGRERELLGEKERERQKEQERIDRERERERERHKSHGGLHSDRDRRDSRHSSHHSSHQSSIHPESRRTSEDGRHSSDDARATINKRSRHEEEPARVKIRKPFEEDDDNGPPSRDDRDSGKQNVTRIVRRVR